MHALLDPPPVIPAATIPGLVIDLLKPILADIADGRYDGKPALFDRLQTLENPALRTFLKLGKSVEGIVVHQPFNTDPSYPLKEWDVITRIGDTPVDDQGMIKLGPNLRVHFEYLVQKIARNGKVPLTVVRANKETPVEVPVSAKRSLVMPGLDGAYPSYFVCGPLVFSSATTELVSGLAQGQAGANWMSRLATVGSPLMRRWYDTSCSSRVRSSIRCLSWSSDRLPRSGSGSTRSFRSGRSGD